MATMPPDDRLRGYAQTGLANADPAHLSAALEEMAPADAEGTLFQLASALFPDGAGDLTQLTWPETGAPNDARAVDRVADSEARLRAAELRYRTLIEQIPAVTFMAALGEGDNEIYVSPHIEALLGFTQKEWLENPFLWYTQLHPEDRELWHQEFAKGVRTGGPFKAECRFIARDGRIVWVHGEARLVRDELGRPLFLQGVAFDITEAKRAQARIVREAVETTEERYRDLVEQLGAVFWEADTSNRGFTFVSRGAERLLGYPRERWLSDPDFWLSTVHPDDRAQASAAWERARALGGGADQFEFRAVTAAGRVVWLHQRVHVHSRDSGSSRLLGVMLDITDRKRAEEILVANEARLRIEANVRGTLHRIGTALASELDLERVVQLATDEITALTTAEFGAFFYNVVNDDGEAYTLYTLSGVPREAFADLPMPRNTTLFGPTFRGEHIVRLDDVTIDPRYGQNAPYFGTPAAHLPVRSYLAVPVIARSGDVIGGMFLGHSRAGVFTEEHERLAEGIAGSTAVAIENARLYAAAERARTAAEAANRAKDEFLATMSHELRTPLNAILGWAMILRTSGDSEAMRRRALETIERNARAQTQIIEDLLDVSRIVTGKLGLNISAVDLVTVIDSVLDSVRLAADSKRIELRRRVDRTAAVVTGDAMRLHQVVSNLLTNAVKFTPPGGWIEVVLERGGEMARIRVQDNGIGMRREFLPHVFERFRQADSSTTRTHGGLGLGLAIVRHLVDLHGGTVHADSAGEGQGSTFTVEIPLFRSSTAVEDTRAETHATLNNVALPLTGVRVLVVDDERDSRELISLLLEQAGAVITAAASAAEALDLIDQVAPHVLVTDIGMPEQDGFDLLRLVRRRHSPSSSVPAVAVTAYARPEDHDQALAAGFHAHVAKPVSPPELVATVERLAAAMKHD
jgi:PAS domain S-box-containing protein